MSEKRTLGSLELNRIYQMDCIEGMRLLPDDSVDLIVIDPHLDDVGSSPTGCANEVIQCHNDH